MSLIVKIIALIGKNNGSMSNNVGDNLGSMSNNVGDNLNQ